MGDSLSVALDHARQKARLDRLFYVPFWECPFDCAFCCVDAPRGRPPRERDGPEVLSSLVYAMAERRGAPIQVHVFGGEPLMRPAQLLRLGALLAENPAMSKLHLYTTLRFDGAERLRDLLGEDLLRIVVNPETRNPQVEERMEGLRGVAEWYRNPIVFPTGRGRLGSDGYRTSNLERWVFAGWPGRS